MYYELLKIMFDSEKWNRSHSNNDEAETMGNIGGHLKLTNKFKPNIYQGFIRGFDEISKPTKTPEVFLEDSQNMYLFKKLETLEQSHSSLQQHISSIEKTNKLLVEEIKTLKEKGMEMNKHVKIIQEKQNVLENIHQSQDQGFPFDIMDLSKRPVQDNAVNMFKQINEEKQHSTKEKINLISDDSGYDTQAQNVQHKLHQDDTNKKQLASQEVEDKVDELYKTLDSYMNNQQQLLESLKENVMISLKENSRKVDEAEYYVNYFRDLNLKLLDKFRIEITSTKVIEKSTMKEKGSNPMSHVFENFKDKHLNKKNEIRSNGFDNRSEVIDSLLESVKSLESKYSDILENMELMNSLVNDNKVNIKDIELVLTDKKRKDMKSIENQLNTIYIEYEKMLRGFTDMKNEKLLSEKALDSILKNFMNDVDKDIETLSKHSMEQTKLITKTDDKMSAIIEQANTLMINDVKQAENINSIQKSLEALNEKFNDLESADLFLQESYRLLTEKTMLQESQIKKVADEKLQRNNSDSLNKSLFISDQKKLISAKQKFEEVSFMEVDHDKGDQDEKQFSDEISSISKSVSITIKLVFTPL